MPNKMENVKSIAWYTTKMYERQKRKEEGMETTCEEPMDCEEASGSETGLGSKAQALLNAYVLQLLGPGLHHFKKWCLWADYNSKHKGSYEIEPLGVKGGPYPTEHDAYKAGMQKFHELFAEFCKSQLDEVIAKSS